MEDRSHNQSNRRRIALLPVLVAVGIAALLLAGVAVTGLGHQSAGASTGGAHSRNGGITADGGTGNTDQQGAAIGDPGNPAGDGNPGAGSPGGQGGQGDPKNPGNPKDPGKPKNPGGPKLPWWTNNPTVPIISGNDIPPVKPPPEPPWWSNPTVPVIDAGDVPPVKPKKP
jgi:hypothetical protein